MAKESSIIKSISSNDVSIKDWADVQQKTFLRYINMKLEEQSYPRIDSLLDLSDGIVLFNLLKCLNQNLEIKPIYANPTLKIQKMENLNKFLEFLKGHEKLQIYNIGSEDIVEGNLKLILGLIWVLILNYTAIEEDSSDSSDLISKKELLLRWCQKVTSGYNGVKLKNFTTSWSDGLALCAIMSYFQPELLKYDELDPTNTEANIELALNLAGSLGISKLLDVEDLNCSKPDEKSVIAYVSLWYDKFRSMKIHNEKEKTKDLDALRIRMETFIAVISEIMNYKNEYLERIDKLADIVNRTITKLEDVDKEKIDMVAVIEARENLSTYRSGYKFHIYNEFNALRLLKSKIDLMMLEFHFEQFKEIGEKSILGVGASIKKLDLLEHDLDLFVTDFISSRKTELVHKFNRIASNADLGVSLIESEVADLPNYPQSQITELPEILDDLETLEKLVKTLKVVKNELDTFYELYNNNSSITNLEQTDQDFKLQEIEYKIKLIKNVINDKLKFIESQLAKSETIAKSLKKTLRDKDSELSDLQTYQFELIFDEFDKGQKKYLNKLEFQAALLYIYPDLKESQISEFFEVIYENSHEVLRGVRLESFLKILEIFNQPDEEEEKEENKTVKAGSRKENEDGSELLTLTSDFYLNTFKEISDGKHYITNDDLSKIELRADMIEKLGNILEQEETVEEVATNKSYNYVKFFEQNEDSVIYMNGFDSIKSAQSSPGKSLRPKRSTATLENLDNVLGELEDLDIGI
ncbi:hypothetical protein CANARDRAFT_28811 [[Candida] arabinofermentans NRRL YB-2248]|uniref:Calponin-homology (CH) domain-containing protein n=1 Tax=[Candida] arabinofermentans NRRL YB-2248 TaxID=983967 RepID=A0A1E4T064_9ASCO|nr:hypothetical protein CANARDRAFT_28811 [[Candida] arabinofermentans NRRL YB-2248]